MISKKDKENRSGEGRRDGEGQTKKKEERREEEKKEKDENKVNDRMNKHYKIVPRRRNRNILNKCH